MAAGMLLSAVPAIAEELRLSVGNPIAGREPNMKGSAFVVRFEGCPEPDKARIVATAEGIVDGARRSMPVHTIALKTPGVYAIPREWSDRGVWVVTLTGTYKGQTAGAIVPLGPRGLIREDVWLRGAAPASGDVEALLRKLSGSGGGK